MPNTATAVLMIAIIVFLALACAFVYLTTPNKFRMFDLPAVYCHRGSFDNAEIPENSLSAFRRSAEQGLAVELDVRPTRDGKIVVFHDSNISRMCGGDHRVRDLSFEELSEYRLLGTEEKIPLFSEVLKVCAGVPVYCEVKTEGAEVEPEFLERVYELIKDYEGQVVIVSFSPFVLKWFRANHPELIRGQLSAGAKHLKGGGPIVSFALANLMFNFLAKPDFISFRFDDSSLGLSMNKIYGTRLAAWTVRSMEDVETAADDGYSTFVGELFDMTEV